MYFTPYSNVVVVLEYCYKESKHQKEKRGPNLKQFYFILQDDITWASPSTPPDKTAKFLQSFINSLL